MRTLGRLPSKFVIPTELSRNASGNSYKLTLTTWKVGHPQETPQLLRSHRNRRKMIMITVGLLLRTSRPHKVTGCLAHGKEYESLLDFNFTWHVFYPLNDIPLPFLIGLSLAQWLARRHRHRPTRSATRTSTKEVRMQMQKKRRRERQDDNDTTPRFLSHVYNSSTNFCMLYTDQHALHHHSGSL